MAIEMNQGIAGSGRVFGYDHKRKNFIEWEIRNERICIASIEHDSEESDHGLATMTRRDAAKVAADENRKPNSSLAAAIRAAGTTYQGENSWINIS